MARRKATGWTCPRVTHSMVCRYRNPPRTRICSKCGKPRPTRAVPAHMRVLKRTYEEFLAVNGGVERCGICGRPPLGRRLCRDHDHTGAGRPRGLLCPTCNRALTQSRYGLKMTPQWLRAAAAYLERTTAA